MNGLEALLKSFKEGVKVTKSTFNNEEFYKYENGIFTDDKQNYVEIQIFVAERKDTNITNLKVIDPEDNDWKVWTPLKKEVDFKEAFKAFQHFSRIHSCVTKINYQPINSQSDNGLCFTDAEIDGKWIIED